MEEEEVIGCRVLRVTPGRPHTLRTQVILLPRGEHGMGFFDPAEHNLDFVEPSSDSPAFQGVDRKGCSVIRCSGGNAGITESWNDRKQANPSPSFAV